MTDTEINELVELAVSQALVTIARREPAARSYARGRRRSRHSVRLLLRLRRCAMAAMQFEKPAVGCLRSPGGSALAVAHRLGHSDLALTLRNYGHLFEGVQSRAHRPARRPVSGQPLRRLPRWWRSDHRRAVGESTERASESTGIRAIGRQRRSTSVKRKPPLTCSDAREQHRRDRPGGFDSRHLHPTSRGRPAEGGLFIG